MFATLSAPVGFDLPTEITAPATSEFLAPQSPPKEVPVDVKASRKSKAATESVLAPQEAKAPIRLIKPVPRSRHGR